MRYFFVQRSALILCRGWAGRRKAGRSVYRYANLFSLGTMIGVMLSGLNHLNRGHTMTNLAPSATAPTVFQFTPAFQVRVLIIDNEPWFCLRDVCKILELDRTSNLIKSLDKGGVVKNHTPTKSGDQDMTYISEPNLYRVIFRSNKPEAKTFQDWVFNDVLPAIRKTGQYQKPAVKPYATEYISNAQYHELKHLVWMIGNNFHQTGGGTFAAWRVLRKELGCEVAAKLPAEHFDTAKARLEALEKQCFAFKSTIMDTESKFMTSLFKTEPDWAALEQDAKRLGLG